MHAGLRILMAWSVLCAVLVGDEWTDTFGGIDAAALARDAQLLPLASLVVRKVDAGSVAAKMGLQTGDLLVGLDGLRIYGSGEWDLVRFRRPCQPGEMRVAIWRAGALVECSTHDAQPVQRLGFDFGDAPGALETALTALAVPACGWASFPRRAGAALLRWQAGAPAGAEHAWIGDLARLYALLADQRWAEAAALVVQPPDPDLAVLAAFYHRLALRHAQGEQEPDPERLGSSAPWYAIHYPYPRLVLPELGAFTHPDPVFLAALATVREDPAGTDHDRAAQARTLQPLGEESYVVRVRMAAIDGEHHSGWPFRHQEVVEDGTRPALIARLRAQVAAGGDQAAWLRFCLICPLLIQQRQVDGPEQARPFLDVLDEVRRDSPLLGYLGAINAERALKMWQISGVGDQFAGLIMAAPFPLTARPSRFLDAMRARDPGLEFQLIGPEQCRWPAHLAGLYAAQLRTSTVADLRQRLAAAAAADQAKAAPLDAVARAALVAEATACFRDAPTLADARLLAALCGPGAGAGLLVAACSEILYRQSADEHDVAWLAACLDGLDTGTVQVATVAGARAALAQVPWGDAAAAGQAVGAAAEAWGSSAGLLVLSEVCASHGRGELAAELRQRVVVLQQRIREYAQRQHLDRSSRGAFDARLLMEGLLSPATVPLAIAAGERCGKGRTPDQEWDSVQLGLAVAYLAAGRRDDALGVLTRSFVVGRRDGAPLFWCDGEALQDSVACRSWALRRIIAAQALAAAERTQLLGVVRPALIDDAFAAALGVERTALPADPQAKDANDF